MARDYTTDYFGRPYGLTRDQIESILNADLGTQTASWRFRLIDRDTLHPVNTGYTFNSNGYVDTADLGPAASASGYSQSRDDDVQMRLNGFSLDLSLAPAVDPLHHYIQVVHQAWSGPDQERLYFEKPVGLFSMTLDERLIDYTGQYLNATLLDWTSMLTEIELITPYTVKGGTNIQLAIQAALTQSNMPTSQGGTGTTPNLTAYAGPGLSLSRMTIDPTDVTLPMDRTWDRGTAVSTLVKELGEIPGYAGFYGDPFGQLYLPLKPNLRESIPAIDRVYDMVQRQNILSSVSERFLDFESLANLYHLYSEPADDTSSGIEVEVANMNTDSAISIPRLGRVRPKSEVMNNITDSGLLQRAALIGLQEVTSLQAQLSFDSYPDPWSMSGDNLDVTVNDPLNLDVVLISSTIGWVEQGYEVDFEQQIQSHTLLKR